MGMFDWYEPLPPLLCPKCRATLSGWQGKDGPCGLFLWVQGQVAPTAQRVDTDSELPRPERNKLTLPNQFELYTECSSCSTRIDALGWTENGRWTHAYFANPLEPPGLPDSWMPLQHDDRQLVLAALHRQIRPGHPLEAARLFPLARRRDRDDVLLRVCGTDAPLCVVNITSRSASDPIAPSLQHFEHLQAFVDSL